MSIKSPKPKKPAKKFTVTAVNDLVLSDEDYRWLADWLLETCKPIRIMCGLEPPEKVEE
jgi:hypothetical protein